MIDALIAGRIHGTPVQRDGRHGAYAVAKVRVTVRDGESYFVAVIAFAAQPVAALLALSDGDSVALSGELTPKVYQPQDGPARPSLDLLAHSVLTTYHVQRKRQAMRTESAEAGT